jgi:hypothetical protein
MYLRVTRDSPTGVIRHMPALGSSSCAKIGGLSKRDQHSQSIDPARDTSATERPSPMIA